MPKKKRKAVITVEQWIASKDCKKGSKFSSKRTNKGYTVLRISREDNSIFALTTSGVSAEFKANDRIEVWTSATPEA